jgi:hypothetical protein
LAGLLLPLATVFLLLLCNDPAVLGPWINRSWLNALAAVIISVLVVLSLILMVTTVFSHVDVVVLSEWLGVGLVACLLIGGVLWLVRRPSSPSQKFDREFRANWRMPPLNLLERPELTGWRRATLGGLAGYLVLSVILLVVKAVQIG